MSEIVRFPTTIIFVAAIIFMNVILLGSITTYKTFDIHPPFAYALQRGVAAAGITALINKVNALSNQRNCAQAIQYYDKALASNANDEVALDNTLAEVYLEMSSKVQFCEISFSESFFVQ